MRILHIIPSYLPATFSSGPILPTHNLNKELVKRGVEVVVYTTNLDGAQILDVPLNKEINLDGVKVFYFPITCRSWQYSWKLRRALAQNVKNFDLIQITSVFLAAGALGAYYAKKFQKPYIISPHGSLMKEPLAMKGAFRKKIYLNFVERSNLAGAAAIHFTVEKEREEYLAAGLPIRKSIIIPNSLDPSALACESARKQKKVLFLSRLNWKKGLDTLIPAFAEVIKKESNAVLILAGPDENHYQKVVEALIKNYKLEIGKNVIFTGMVLGDEKNAFLWESSVFVLPSYSENFGIAVVEAMAAELPVVITRGVGISNEVERAHAGIVVEKNTRAVAEAILKILADPALAKKMGEAGRILVQREFSGEKVAERWIEEYEKIYHRD